MPAGLPGSTSLRLSSYCYPLSASSFQSAYRTAYLQKIIVFILNRFLQTICFLSRNICNIAKTTFAQGYLLF